MNASESLPILREWERVAKALRKQIRALTAKTSPIRVEPESPLLDAIFAMDSAYSDSVEIRITGESFKWLEWYANENDFGRKALEAGPPASMRPIRTLRDLAWLLEVAA